MKILDYMTITEAAEVIKVKAVDLKEKMKITEQEAYNIIFTNVEKYLDESSSQSKNIYKE